MSAPRAIPELIELGERVLADSTHIFEDHDNRHEAEQLLAFVLKTTVEELDAVGPPSPSRRDRYLALVARRAGGEPFPFLTGQIRFYGVDLKVRPGAFVPRPSSELTVATALRRLRRRRAPKVVDLCTGAGPIALLIAYERPDAEVWGADIAAEGLALARENRARLGIDNVSFRRGDLFGALPKSIEGSIDVITAHVPYVPPDELQGLPAEVREHEPLYTLTDRSDDGLGLMRRTVQGAPLWLEPGGWLLLEMSDDLAPKARRICTNAGLEYVGVASDEDGLSVVVEARRPLR